MQAVDRAKLQEKKIRSFVVINDHPKLQIFFFTTTQPSSSSTPTNPPLLPKPPTNVPVKRLSFLNYKSVGKRFYVILAMKTYLDTNAKVNSFC